MIDVGRLLSEKRVTIVNLFIIIIIETSLFIRRKLKYVLLQWDDEIIHSARDDKSR